MDNGGKSKKGGNPAPRGVTGQVRLASTLRAGRLRWRVLRMEEKIPKQALK